MKQLYIVLLTVISLNLNGQVLFDVPDQFTRVWFYDDVDLEDYIDLSTCYDFTIGVETFPGSTVGHPNLAEDEYKDYRENMTLTLKLKYAGFELASHPDDKLWVFDDNENLTEVNIPFNDPFSLTGKLFFLNVKGDFTKYQAKLVYYSGSADKTFTLNDAFEYASNRVIGDPLEPYIIDFAPVVFTIEDHSISTEIISDMYAGGLCLNVVVDDCEGNEIGSDVFCYEFGDSDCPRSLTIFQSDIDEINTGIFKAFSEIVSSAKVIGNRTVVFSAQECITLGSGFEIQLGSELLIDTIGCF